MFFCLLFDLISRKRFYLMLTYFSKKNLVIIFKQFIQRLDKIDVLKSCIKNLWE